MGFDIVFGLQHWVLYPATKGDFYEDERRVAVGQDEEGRGLLPDERGGGEYGTI